MLRPYAGKTNKKKPKTQVKNRYLGHPNPRKRQTQDPGTNSVPGAPKPKKEQTQEKAHPRTDLKVGHYKGKLRGPDAGDGGVAMGAMPCYEVIGEDIVPGAAD